MSETMAARFLLGSETMVARSLLGVSYSVLSGIISLAGKISGLAGDRANRSCEWLSPVVPWQLGVLAGINVWPWRYPMSAWWSPAGMIAFEKGAGAVEDSVLGTAMLGTAISGQSLRKS